MKGCYLQHAFVNGNYCQWQFSFNFFTYLLLKLVNSISKQPETRTIAATTASIIVRFESVCNLLGDATWIVVIVVGGIVFEEVKGVVVG